jgi:hypothetical protein
MMAVVSITKQDAESLIDGAAVALQWGEVSNACVCVRVRACACVCVRCVRVRACANVLYCATDTPFLHMFVLTGPGAHSNTNGGGVE